MVHVLLQPSPLVRLPSSQASAPRADAVAARRRCRSWASRNRSSPVSMVHVVLQPSPLKMLPSSQVSPVPTVPSPQEASASPPAVKVEAGALCVL